MVALVEKAKNAGISLYPGEIERLRSRAKLRDGGSPTRYFRRLFEADEKGEPISASYDPDILSKLARIYAGYFAPKLARALGQFEVDQPSLLHKLLSELQECFACAAQPHELVVVPRWELNPNHKWYMPKPAERIMPMAAEDSAHYGA